MDLGRMTDISIISVGIRVWPDSKIAQESLRLLQTTTDISHKDAFYGLA